jgi:four helix bundle protein
MAASIRDLKVWQEAVALASDVVRAARQGARRETKVVTDQLMATALAAACAIADGYGRYTAPEQRQLYRAAKRELLKLETQIAIARGADLISTQTHTELSARIQSVTRLLGGFLVYLERQLTPEANGDRTAAVR